MALIDINFNPTAKELRWFGFIIFVFFALIAGIVFWSTGGTRAPFVLVIVGILISAVYYSVPPLRLPVYRLWMHLVFPIGWVFSHLLFGFLYYGIVTPIGSLMRLFGHDPLHRRRVTGASTYWAEHQPDTDPARYFRQF